MKKWISFLQFFFIQLVQYCICCISYIALSRYNYTFTAITDTIYGINSFFLIKKIVKSDAAVGLDTLGYVMGGTVGSLLAIWVSKHLMH
jgi:hypothetical protein